MSKWWWKADYYETCNCAHGCPCNLTMIPTDGTCKAIDAWHIREGEYDGVSLAGLSLALLVHWPNPIHEGNGQAVVFIDESADEAQREALAAIGTGKAGSGGPFEIFATTYSEPAKVVYGPVTMQRDGKSAKIRFGQMGEADFGPVISAMDGAPANARMVLPGGFIFEEADIVNTDHCKVDTGDFRFEFENSSAFLTEVAYNTN